MGNDTDLNNEQKKSTSVSSAQKFKYALVGGAVMLVVAGAAGAAYYYGVVQTRKETVSDTLQKLIDPTALLNIPENITGDVAEVSADTIRVEGREKQETVYVASDVPITKKGKNITLNEISQNDTATVLFERVDNKLQATRILVR